MKSKFYKILFVTLLSITTCISSNGTSLFLINYTPSNDTPNNTTTIKYTIDFPPPSPILKPLPSPDIQYQDFTLN